MLFSISFLRDQFAVHSVFYSTFIGETPLQRIAIAKEIDVEQAPPDHCDWISLQEDMEEQQRGHMLIIPRHYP